MEADRTSDTSSDEEEDTEKEEEEDGRKLKDVVVGEPGPLTLSLLSFVQEMNQTGNRTTVTPNVLFGNICKQAPRFRGFQQQDSQELLRYLVDVVRSGEIKRAQTGIFRYFKMPEKVNPKDVDDATKMKIKEYGRQDKFTVLDSLFGGQLVSAVTCAECKNISQIFEPFLDLSLPVTEEKPQRPNQILGGQHKNASTVKTEAAQKEVSPPAKGVDGFAEGVGKPSKYQERKNRKQAKRDARKKRKKRKKKKKKKKGPAVQAEERREAGGR